MPAHVALLRAVNVTGANTLPMADLVSLATSLGLSSPRTYIASGNLVFHSPLPEPELVHLLEAALLTHMGKPIGVLLRTAPQLAQILADDPFPEAPGNQSLILFLPTPPPSDLLSTAKNLTNERIALGLREIYIHYPSGQGQSRLRIPAAAHATGRNRNTIAKLAQLAADLDTNP